jgi:hypothetical protein
MISLLDGVVVSLKVISSSSHEISLAYESKTIYKRTGMVPGGGVK